MTNKSRKKLFVNATNVHAGGGKSLLNALLQSLPHDLRVVALLDTRMETPATPSHGLEIKRVQPTIWQRLKAEFWLACRTRKNDVVLCFGNLPPLFQLRGCSFVFMQNRYLFDRTSLKNFPITTQLRLKAERLWVCWKSGNADAFIVQTPAMRTMLELSGLAAQKPIYMFPFVDLSHGYSRKLDRALPAAMDRPLIYVASGEPHKNHRNLVQAWCILAQEGLFPTLWLTLDAATNSELCTWIDHKTCQFSLLLKNLGAQPHEQILQLYTQVQALVYPSTVESFGIPLIEARQAGLAVIASELDFVRDVLDPEQVFDPTSPVSIARAVRRFLGLEEKSLPLLNAAEFLTNVLEKCE